jgi:hypothetical protein
MIISQLHEASFKRSKRTGLMLKHGPSGSYHFEYNAADGFETLEGLFPEVLDGSLRISGCKDLVSLKGAPKIIHGGFAVTNCPKLHSLEHGPKHIDKIFVCSAHSFTSFEHMPRTMSEFICNQAGSPTPITSLHNLHKMVDKITWRISVDHLTSHILSVLLIPGDAKYFNIDYGPARRVSEIIEKYMTYPRGMSTVLACQDELIDAGFDEFAQL